MGCIVSPFSPYPQFLELPLSDLGGLGRGWYLFRVVLDDNTDLHALVFLDLEAVPASPALRVTALEVCHIGKPLGKLVCFLYLLGTVSLSAGDAPCNLATYTGGSYPGDTFSFGLSFGSF